MTKIDYKNCVWVTVVENNCGFAAYDQCIGNAYPLIEVKHRKSCLEFVIEYPRYKMKRKVTPWHLNEIRESTPEEIKKAIIRMTADRI